MTADARLTVTGAASVQMLLRVVNLIAQRGMPPRRIEAIVREDEMTIRIDVAGSAGPGWEALGERLRSLVEVAEVSEERRVR